MAAKQARYKAIKKTDLKVSVEEKRNLKTDELSKLILRIKSSQADVGGEITIAIYPSGKILIRKNVDVKLIRQLYGDEFYESTDFYKLFTSLKNQDSVKTNRYNEVCAILNSFGMASILKKFNIADDFSHVM